MFSRNSKPQKSVALNIEGVGEVRFQESTRARHLNIRIKPFAGVQVSVPHGMSFSKAREIVRSKSTWILKNLQKIKQFENHSMVYDGSKTLKTRHHKLDVSVSQVNKFSRKINKDVVRIQYPGTFAVTDPEVQSVIQNGLIAAYRREAKAFLPGRVEELAKKHGLKYNQVFIKNHKSRWGSCSAKKNINLNLQLMRLPDELIDYVILHELVHTKIKNHSAKFWSFLEKIYPRARKLDKRLKNQKF